MDQDLTDEPRAKRIEELLLIIGGAEVMYRHNKFGEFGAHPPLAKQAREIQKKYLKKLERLMNGLPEDES